MQVLASMPITALTHEDIANLAVQSLLEEVRLTPKPGLVDKRGSGVHADLTLELMEQSAQSLRATFVCFAEAAAQHQWVNQFLREELARIGRIGEHAMMKVTHGVNTHRGAIWSLGLLIGSLSVRHKPANVLDLLGNAGALARMEDRFYQPKETSNGLQVKRVYGVEGAREQAEKNFPQILDGLEELYRCRAQGTDEQSARVDALLAIASKLSDTCVVHRSGLDGLRWMQTHMHRVLKAGGISSQLGAQHYEILEAGMLKRNASPGGAADLLSACLFIDSLITRGTIAWKS